jgi:hypothetical protein
VGVFYKAVLGLSFGTLPSVSPPSWALQEKSLTDVGSDALISEIQITPSDAGDGHSRLVWWVPKEFWAELMSREEYTSPTHREGMLSAVEGISILAVVQSGISPIGSFEFHPRKLVKKNFMVTCAGKTGDSPTVSVLKELNSDTKTVLSAFEPILSSAMGKMDENMHFFVLDDTVPPGSRRPVRKIRLRDKKSRSLISTLELLPVLSLRAPARPNPSPAHLPPRPRLGILARGQGENFRLTDSA